MDQQVHSLEVNMGANRTWRELARENGWKKAPTRRGNTGGMANNARGKVSR